MNMKIALRSHHTRLAELNLTPLLDLVFVLLVIFIIATPQRMNNLELSLPSDQPPPAKLAPPVQIRVGSGNHIQLDALDLPFQAFKAELARRKAEQPNLAVVVSGADRAEYQAVVGVLELIQQLNISEVGLAISGAEPLQNP